MRDMQDRTMIRRRWMQWVLDEADDAELTFPWTRGRRTGAWKDRLSKADTARFLTG